MKARTLGLVLIAVALIVAFAGQSRSEADSSARPAPTGQTASY